MKKRYSLPFQLFIEFIKADYKPNGKIIYYNRRILLLL
jgi:hypothetical protein